MRSFPLLVAFCVLATCGIGRTVSSVAEAIKLAEGGFRGEVEITGLYDFSSEEDTVHDGGEDARLLVLVLLPLLKDVPEGERYAARKRLGDKYHGRRIVLCGEIKKGRVKGYYRDIIHVAVSEIAEQANQSPQTTPVKAPRV
jgi:hypothetical protein